MSMIRIAIPVLRGKRRFHLDKGRPWSVVEHLVLSALSKRPWTAAQLATQGDLPRRLVIEMVVRLMRAGWVELSQGVDGIKFHANAAGKEVAGQDELPNVPKRISRWMNFVIDKVTGTMYRGRELSFYEKHVLEERAKRERLVWMESREIDVTDEVRALVATLFEDDEKLVAIDPTGDRLVDRFALVSVRDGKVEGLPARAPAELEALILEAADHAPSLPVGGQSPSYRPAAQPRTADRRPPELRAITFRSSDLILGGEAHKSALGSILRRTRHRVIIHSTFIAEDKFAEVRPLLFDAVRRGAQIDILWGEDDEKTQSSSTRASVARLRQEIAGHGLEGALRLHPFSTRSHAKLIVADDGHPDRQFALLGSCNWLSSGFKSFEASVRLRNPAIVADVVDQLAELSRGADGHWTDLTNNLAYMASSLRRRPAPSGTHAEAAIVLGPQHAHYVRQARDQAQNRLFVTSHQLGAAARPAVVIPAIAAVEARGIEAKVFYGKPTRNVRGDDAAEMIRVAFGSGVEL